MRYTLFMNPDQRIYRIILGVIGCFAIGSVGFFLAVFMEYNAQPPTQNIKQIHVVSEQQKNAAMQSLSATESSSGVTIVSTSSLLSVPVGQASLGDKNAATKLQILEGLNQK